MDDRILKWLFDIKMSIDEINSYFEKEEKDFFKYQNNLMHQAAQSLPTLSNLFICYYSKVTDLFQYFVESEHTNLK